MSQDTKGFFIFGCGMFTVATLLLASIITIIYDGYQYFQNHDESALGWFIAGCVVLSLYCIVPCVGFLIYWLCIEEREEKKQVVATAV